MLSTPEVIDDIPVMPVTAWLVETADIGLAADEGYLPGWWSSGIGLELLFALFFSLSFAFRILESSLDINRIYVKSSTLRVSMRHSLYFCCFLFFLEFRNAALIYYYS